jgi:FkbM family methyltransferase
MFMNQAELMERYKLHPKGILHVGASEAQEAEAYHALGISRMIFVEAIPEVYIRMLSNISRYPNAEGINACVSDTSTKGVTFNIANNSGQSSSLLEFGLHRALHPEVEFSGTMKTNTVRIDELGLDLKDVDYLVTDLQGCDLRAIKGMGTLIDGFQAVYSEVNRGQTYINNDTIEEMDEYLGQQGFDRVEMVWVTESWGDALYLRKA